MAAPGKVRWREVCSRLVSALEPLGLDLCHPLAASWYNDAVEAHLRMTLPEIQGSKETPESDEPIGSRDCLAVLVGNSKELWSPFLAAYCGNTPAGEELRETRDPIHLYVQTAVAAAAEDAAGLGARDGGGAAGVGGIPWRVYWSHETQPGKLVAIQRMASIAGLAFFDKESYLCIHSTWGPWFSLRAVLLFGVEPPPPSEKPQPLPCPLDSTALARVKAAMARALEEAPESQVAASGAASTRSNYSTTASMPDSRRRWLAVREAIRPDHPMRYSEEQIVYHYTRDISILQSLCKDSSKHQYSTASSV